ncbi:beta-galactosidase [Paramyrothecium foliicola]|nr:beta-galactosidase [Paramyrothecium foliicola]
MKLLTALSALFLLGGSAAAKALGRTKFNFNPDWRVYVGELDGAEAPDFNDDDWRKVTLPYAYNEDDAFRLPIENLTTGLSWYRKTFKIPEKHKGQKFYLEFEGIRHGGEFYFNGKWIGRSGNGVMAFGFDVTDLLDPKRENVVAALINNKWDYREVDTNTPWQWNDRNFYANYGGINKNVYLHITDKLHQTLPLYSNLGTVGPYVYATDIDIEAKTAKVTAETEVRNSYEEDKIFKYKFEVFDAKGKKLKEVLGKEESIKANQTATFSLSTDLSNVEFWSWGYGYLYDVRTSLLVNDEVIDSVTTRTGFRKTEFSKGTFKLNDRTLQLKGYAQRTTNEWPALGQSVPAWLSDFSNRLVLKSNGNLIRWMHVTPWKQDVESLDRLGIIQALPAGDSEADRQDRRWDLRVELMRDATIYNRNNPSVVFYESGNAGISEEHMEEMRDIRDRYDPHGGRAAGSREMLNSTIAEYGGEMLYINKGARIPFWQMEYSRDEGLRKWWDDYSPPFHPNGEGVGQGWVYNRNQDSHAIENVVRWFDYYEARPGTGERVNSGGTNIIFSDSNTHYRGIENYRRSGEVDAMRIPKDAFHAHRVMWDNWVDIERHDSHIIGHWNYADDVVKNVTVISTADKVELFRNGKSLGFGEQSYQFLFNFTNVAFEAGEIKAVGYDKDGKETTSDVRTTAGQPAAIKLTLLTSPNGFKATGADVALVEVEVVDASGKRNPISLDLINFELEGEAEWRGGIAQGPGNYILSKSLPVEGGVNRVLIRSTPKVGSVTLKATAEGLKSASLRFKSQKVDVKNGLSTYFDAEGLPAEYSRGPTPKGESFSIKRRTLKADEIVAGSNAESAPLAADDDEYSSWGSTTTRADAWISFLFSEETSINQVLMKLNGFRTTSYAIAISVDGKQVWAGNTPTNLGYATFTFDTVKGKNVTIASTANRALRITEAELYAPL